MKIYVDELPKSCNDCELGYFYDCQYCSLRPDLAREDIWVEKEKHCPLVSLKSLKQQVREEVVDEIRKQLKDMDFLANDTEFGERFSCYSKYKVLDILLKVERNQVKGESNVKD